MWNLIEKEYTDLEILTGVNPTTGEAEFMTIRTLSEVQLNPWWVGGLVGLIILLMITLIITLALHVH